MIRAIIDKRSPADACSCDKEIKKGHSREKAMGLREMGTLRCDGCGEEFVVNHHRH
jgi:hypothetical protein